MIELASDWKTIDLGDGAGIDIKPLNLRSYHRLLAFMMPYMKDGKLTGKESQKIMLDAALPDILAEVIIGHVCNISGINLDGAEISPEQFVNKAELLAMNITVMSELMAYSSLTVDEEKN